MTNHYDARNIQVLEGLDAVRMRPGMYIGSTGSRGLHHMLWEIVDNSIDEAMAGFATRVDVTLGRDGSVTVQDNGRGMPVDLHPTMGVSGVEVIYTKLHAGGKFNSENYAYSGGLHGVGASVVNALSRWVEVDVCRDFQHWHIRFESAWDEKEKKVVAGRATGPLTLVGNTRERGSRVRFLPDDRVFETVTFNAETVARRLRELAYLNRGLTITFLDEREPVDDGNGEAKAPEREVYRFDGGLVDYVRYLNADKTPLHEEPIYLAGQREDVIFRVAIQYTDSYTENVFSYVNNIPTGEGGTHETGFKAAYTKVMNDFARRLGALKDKDANLSGDDFREGMTAVMLAMVKNPQFEGQTKGKLGNTEVRPLVEAIATKKTPPRPNCSSWRATARAAAPSRGATGGFRRFCRCAESRSTPRKSAWIRCLATRSSAPSSRRWARTSTRISRWRGSSTTRSSSSRTPIRTGRTSAPFC